MGGGLIFIKSIDGLINREIDLFVINPSVNFRYYPGGNAVMGWFLEANVNYSYLNMKIYDVIDFTRYLVDTYLDIDDEDTANIIYFGIATGWKTQKQNSSVSREISIGVSCVINTTSKDGVRIAPIPAPKFTASFGWMW